MPNNSPNIDTVVIASGGLDSAVLLWKLRNEHRHVAALSVDYGQRHRTELTYAKEFCERSQIPHEVADLRAIQRLIGGSSQTDASVEVPKGHYAEESMKATVVPNRNMIMLAVAIGWAVSLKAKTVAFGAHGGDHAIYPDCRENFIQPLTQAASHCDWHPVGIERPFITMTKGDIVAEGARLGVPFEDTYSCYEGLRLHCGRCGTCVERAMAFIEAGVPDPTAYDYHLAEQYVREAQAANLKRARAVVSVEV